MKSTLGVLITIFVATFATKASVLPLHNYYQIFYTSHQKQDDATNCAEKCSSDCLSVMRCIGDQPIEINCKNQTGTLPYCNQDTLECDSSPDHCSAQEPSAICDTNMDGKYYPDINNCQKYYFCDAKKGYPFVCPQNTRYNPKTSMCSTGINCYIFDFVNGLCKGHDNLLVVHPLDPTFYVYCDKQNGPTLHMCDGTNYEFNPKSFKCEYVCKKAGRFKDEKDATCKSYYECIQNGSVFIKQSKQCVGSYIFVDKNNDGTGKCVKSDANNKCEKSKQILFYYMP